MASKPDYNPLRRLMTMTSGLLLTRSPLQVRHLLMRLILLGLFRALLQLVGVRAAPVHPKLAAVFGTPALVRLYREPGRAEEHIECIYRITNSYTHIHDCICTYIYIYVCHTKDRSYIITVLVCTTTPPPTKQSPEDLWSHNSEIPSQLVKNWRAAPWQPCHWLKLGVALFEGSFFMVLREAKRTNNLGGSPKIHSKLVEW